jgi:NitT/TauT family transport system ATP-binding protein
MIAGFEKPDTREILLDGVPVRRPGRDRLVVFQESALFPWMTTEQNILYGPRARGEVTQEASGGSDSPVGEGRAERVSDEISDTAFRGMQRRAELARAMINSPSVMILDEPFRGLAAMTRKLMPEYYAGLGAEGNRTDFFVTTDIDQAILLADRLLVMSHRPTRVRAVIEVDLPRTRDLTDIVTNARANAIKMEALSLLHEEAMKAFAGGSRAAADVIDAWQRWTAGNA